MKAIDRFFRRVESSDDACHLWTGATDPTGYGRFWLDGKMRYAHRVGFEWAKGAIPAGFQVDHLCRVRNCVNPAHLEAVTQRENLLRGETLAAAHASDRDCGFAGCNNCKRFARAAAECAPHNERERRSTLAVSPASLGPATGVEAGEHGAAGSSSGKSGTPAASTHAKTPRVAARGVQNTAAR